MGRDTDRRDGEGFFAGWSRRKRAASRAEAEAEAEADTVRTEQDAIAPASEPEADGDEITAEELAALPPFDEITGSTDLRPFLRRGVPAALRRAAMRKVWLGNALIRDHDNPAVDYAWDWNTPGAVVPGAGGALNGDRVAKMVGDLINRRQPSEAVEPETSRAGDRAAETADAGMDAATDRPQAWDQSNAPDDTVAEPPSDPVRRETRMAARGAVDAGQAAGPDKGDAPVRRAEGSPEPVRRHGGAVPE